jgi:hypothetical protein
MATARKEGLQCGASSGHITNLKQSIFSFDIRGRSEEKENRENQIRKINFQIFR